jgi:hypothetical protein
MNIWVAIAMLIISYIITQASIPTPENARPTAFDDIDFPQAEEGTPQAVIFGDCWSSDWMVLAVGGYRVEPIKGGGSGGKK